MDYQHLEDARSEHLRLELKRRIHERRPYATFGVVALNVLVWAAGPLILSFANLDIVSAGAVWPGVIWTGEPWRIVTGIFLHATWWHLALNMLLVWSVGRFIELVYGPSRFLILYMATGIASSLASMAFLPAARSVGASGAALGLVGVLTGVSVFQKGLIPARFESWFGRWLPPLITLDLVVVPLGFLLLGRLPGVDLPRINNVAHFGGLFFGILLSLAIWPTLAHHSASPYRRSLSVLSLALMALTAAHSYQKAPSTLAYHQARALQHREAGDLVRACEALERGVAIDIDEEERFDILAGSLNTLAWTYLEREVELGRATELAQRAIDITPNPAFLDTLAYLEAARGQCARASDLMDTIVKEIPAFGSRRREVIEACRDGRRPDPDIPFDEPQAQPTDRESAGG